MITRSKTVRRARALLPIAALVLVAATGKDGVEPGAWERRLEFISATQDGKPVPDFTPPEPDVKRRCVSAADAADPARLIIPPVRAGCHVVSRSLADGKVAFTGECDHDGQKLSISAEGSYDRNSFTLDLVTEVPVEGGTAFISGKVSARHVGQCTKDDPPLPTDATP